MRDNIDQLIDQWAEERPDLDARPMGIVGRILRLSMLLEARAESALAPFGLSVWQFDVLATLRRFGTPHRMSPKQLMGEVMLSSGAMTNRIDRLEGEGWVRRLPDPNDRRGVLVELTTEGLALIERAIAARLDEAHDVVARLDSNDADVAEKALRRLLAELEGEKSG